jgi:two-component sensor histidine kinase
MTEMAFTPTISEQALLQELNHRISNEFQSALSLVSVTAAFPQSGG